MSKMRFSKRITFFVFFLCWKIEQKKKKMEKAKNPYKNRVFKVVIQKCEKKKQKMDF